MSYYYSALTEFVKEPVRELQGDERFQIALKCSRFQSYEYKKSPCLECCDMHPATCLAKESPFWDGHGQSRPKKRNGMKEKKQKGHAPKPFDCRVCHCSDERDFVKGRKDLCRVHYNEWANGRLKEKREELERIKKEKIAIWKAEV